MKVIVACEYSGTVRDAFIRKGHDAVSVDLEDSDSNFGPHIKGDIRDVDLSQYDLMIAHPPCTFLTVAAQRWHMPSFPKKVEALEFVKYLLNAPVNKIALENPISVISTRIKKPNQIIQPYDFGHPETKKTCLWLKGLRPLRPTKNVYDEMIKLPPNEKHRVLNYWGKNRKDKMKVRSKTYQGIADAMAEQWGM